MFVYYYAIIEIKKNLIHILLIYTHIIHINIKKRTMICSDILLQKLYSYYKYKRYKGIFNIIKYIHTRSTITNKYFTNNSLIDNYINNHTHEQVQHTLTVFFASIRIYRFIVSCKKQSTKEIINPTNLYGENIYDCKEKIIYLRCNQNETTHKHKYYAFPYSELNKIITHDLHFSFDDSLIISPKYPKNPWTNKKFTEAQLEYIVYMFKYHNLHYHKAIRMFADNSFSIGQFILYHEEYLLKISINNYIKQLSKPLFTKLFNLFWLFISTEYVFLGPPPTRKYLRIPNVVCKKCILSIPDVQNELLHLLSIYYQNFHNIKIYRDEHVKSVILFKKEFVSFLKDEFPHVFKTKDYYHLHYSKFNLKKNIFPVYKLKHPLEFPISGFTDDCKIIYICNGVRCVLQKQVLVAI